MSLPMRILTVTGLLALAACGAAPTARQARPEDRIDCAIGNAGDFVRDCSVDRDTDGMLVLRHVDGGFRRLTRDVGGAIAAADGADMVVAQPLDDGRIELTVGGDRYRLPAGL